MAVNGRMYLLLTKLINARANKHLVPSIISHTQLSLSAVHGSSNKLSKAMQAYMVKAKEYDDYMKQQFQEFEDGKKHLANMMGKDHRKMTQQEIDECIEYLLPSALYVPKARPMMKPPDQIMGAKKPVPFDASGRPLHFLFYTTKQTYSQLLHDAAKEIQKLNDLEFRNISKGLHPPKPLDLSGSVWLSKTALEALLCEKLYDVEYNKYIEVFETLSQHPYAEIAENFINSYRQTPSGAAAQLRATPTVAKDGFLEVTVPKSLRDTAIAKVVVKCPGTGLISINGAGIDYFETMTCREQVLFPLLLSEMLGKVDFEATVEQGGPTSQAGAIRFGLSKALSSLVSPDIVNKMKLAGLLQREFRRRERKKPGQDGARKKYTWLKR